MVFIQYLLYLKYFRLKLIGMGTSITGVSQAIYHRYKSKPLTHSINEKITAHNDCELTRTILTGEVHNGRYKNIITNANGHLLTRITEPTSAFGELRAINMEPISQDLYIYNINNAKINYDGGTIIGMNTEGTGGSAQIQTITTVGGAQFTDSGAADYFHIYAGGGGQFYVWFDVDNGNSDPAPGGTGIEVDIGASDSPSTIASSLSTAVDGNANFSASVSNNVVTITNAANGDVTSIQPGTMPSSSASAVAHDATNSMVSTTADSGIGAFSQISSSRAMKYRSGQGAITRFSAIFDTGVAGTEQIAGCGNQVSGLFFGYNGTSFGILHRSAGQPDIYKLQITTGATGGGSVLITLDGIDYPIPVTSGTQTHNAYEISMSSLFGRGDWTLEFVNDVVYFKSVTSTGARSNTYAFSANGVASVAGTITSVTTGIAVVNTWIPQEEWNIERFDGYGNVKHVLNPQKGNVYQIEFQWLGFGSIIFSIEEEDIGVLTPVHRIYYANRNTVPSMVLPYMRNIFTVSNTTAVSTPSIKTASCGLFVEGQIKLFNGIHSTSGSKTTTDGNETPILSIRNISVYSGKENFTEVHIRKITVSNDATKSGIIRLYLGGTIGQTSYQFVNETESSMVYDTTNTTVPSGGTILESAGIAGSSTVAIDISSLNIIIKPGDILTLTAQRSTNTNVEITTTITWQEDR